jgi:hypothetical protein
VAAKRVDDFVFVVSAREIPTPCRWQLKFIYGHRETSGLRDALSYTNFARSQPLATLHIAPKHLNFDETGAELRLEIARAVSRRIYDASNAEFCWGVFSGGGDDCACGDNGL